MGYYAHLITDAEHQRFIRDEHRVKACWDRIKQHLELSKLAVGMSEEEYNCFAKRATELVVEAIKKYRENFS